MKSRLFGIYLVFGVVEVSWGTLSVEPGHRGVRSVAGCVAQVARLLAGRQMAIEFSRQNEDLTSEILRRTRVPVVLNAPQTRVPTGVEHRTSTDLMIILNGTSPDRILDRTLWNGETRFFIVSEKLANVRLHFQEFWKHKVINVFALIPTNDEVSAYSFLPYGRNDCNVPEPLVVDECRGGKFAKKGSVFKDPVRIKNMNGCPVNITVNDAKPSLIFESTKDRRIVSDVTGYEGNMLVQVSKSLNFAAHFKQSEDGTGWGWLRPVPHGTVADVYNGISEMCGGMLAALQERYELLDVSVTYNVDECLTYAVHKGLGRKKPAWITIFVSDFGFSTWALIIFSFVSICINMWLIDRYSGAKWFADKSELVVSVFSGCLGSPINIPDRTSAKTSAGFWLVFGFVVTVAYKAAMGSKMTVPPVDPDISTYEELMDTDFEVNGMKTMSQAMLDSDIPVYMKMSLRYRASNKTVQEEIERIGNRERVAHLRHESTLLYYSLLNPKTRGQLHILKGCVFYFSPLVILQKYSPFTNKVNQILTRLDESGIVKMWKSQQVYRIPTDQKPFIKLSNNQMFGSYFILLLGYVVASLCFVCEHLCHFRQSNRK